jgi:hypothetical protein
MVLRKTNKYLEKYIKLDTEKVLRMVLRKMVRVPRGIHSIGYRKGFKDSFE